VSSSGPREVCYRCLKPRVTCICGSLPRVENRTEVLVLQHPRERSHPIGTARFASLGLANARTIVAWNAGARETEPPGWLPEGTALLYPGDGARDLRLLETHERPSALLVLDGTWFTARTLYRDKLWLRRLPHYRFLPSTPGRYRIRREPQLDYVSTIEAIVEALRILEPETAGFAELIAAFDAMIDQQLTYIGQGGPNGRVRKRRRPAAERRVPHALVEGFERLVVIYGEPSRPSDPSDREFVYFTAVAPHSGARLERLMLPETGVPDVQHLTHMGLAVTDFDAAHGGRPRPGAPHAFRDAWLEFLASCGPAPLIAAWNQRTLEFLAEQTDTDFPKVVLKGAYRAVFGADTHSLEQVVAERGLAIPSFGFKGRAARRLGSAVSVARLLNERATSEKSRTSNIGQTPFVEEPDHEQPPD
jgi:DTW domain-containing protein YfiP